MIALLCPTRARPEKCKRMIESVKATSKADVFLSTDPMDIWAYKYGHNIEATDWVNTPHGMPTSHKWNILAQEAMKRDYRLFMLAADDMVFEDNGWDKALLALCDGKPRVFALQDSRDHDGTPHIIVTREWINLFGWFVPPIFTHWHIDGWSVEIAKSAGCFTHLREFRLTHDKPSDKGITDSTHNDIRQWGWRERDAYVADTCKDWLELQCSILYGAVNG